MNGNDRVETASRAVRPLRLSLAPRAEAAMKRLEALRAARNLSSDECK